MFSYTIKAISSATSGDIFAFFIIVLIAEITVERLLPLSLSKSPKFAMRKTFNSSSDKALTPRLEALSK